MLDYEFKINIFEMLGIPQDTAIELAIIFIIPFAILLIVSAYVAIYRHNKRKYEVMNDLEKIAYQIAMLNGRF